MVGNGANTAGRNPPFCCISRRLLAIDTLIFAIRRTLSLYFPRHTFSRGVSSTVPLSMLCAHSHSALIRSASAYSSMTFRSFVFFVLLSIWRQTTCLFTRPDIARMTVVPTRQPFCTRPPRIVRPRRQLWDFAHCVVQRYTSTDTSRGESSWNEEWRSAHDYCYFWHIANPPLLPHDFPCEMRS